MYPEMQDISEKGGREIEQIMPMSHGLSPFSHMSPSTLSAIRCPDMEKAAHRASPRVTTEPLAPVRGVEMFRQHFSY